MYPNITFGVDSSFTSCAWPVMPAWVSTIVGFDSAFIPYSCGSAVQWILQMISLLSTISLNNKLFHLTTLWLPADFSPPNLDQLLQTIPNPWRYNSAVYN